MSLSHTVKQFAVIGNPISHSRSPFIHREFAAQTGIALEYDLREAPLDGFAASVKAFFHKGGSGLNVTLPFKEEAFVLAQSNLSQRARLAGAVNTLWMQDEKLHGCNTDGVGLLADIERLGFTLNEKRVLIVGAGGAAKGLVYPFLEAGCQSLRVVNRTATRALELKAKISEKLPELDSRLFGGGLDTAQGVWDVVINATSGSLSGQAPALHEMQYAAGALAYDLVYANDPTPFMKQAQEHGAHCVADGLGMLVSQAAVSFEIWHGILPDIAPVLQSLRSQLSAL